MEWKIKLKPLFIVLALILTAGIFSACGADAPREKEQDSPSESIDAVLPPEEYEPSRAEQVTKALAAAYPRRILKAEYRNSDWAVLLRDTWFYYAEGRLLPEALVDRASEYSPVIFYNYPAELPPWTTPTPEQIAQYREWANARNPNRPQRSHYFFDALYRAHNYDESNERVKSFRFLGNPVTVHYSILEPLSLVEARILAASRTDTQVRAWIDSLGTVTGWGWRTMEGTQIRSFHSYGVAIDLLPRSLGGRATFWQWAEPEWWNIPYERRYHPPETVIKAFETYGFAWGGKWPLFDTMHFEYRPEVFILNGIELPLYW